MKQSETIYLNDTKKMNDNKSKQKRFNQTSIFSHFNAKCEYVDPKSPRKCNSQERSYHSSSKLQSF